MGQRSLGIASAGWRRVIDGGWGIRKLGGRAIRRGITPEWECDRRAVQGLGSGSGFDSGSSSEHEAVGDVRMNDAASVPPTLHRTA